MVLIGSLMQVKAGSDIRNQNLQSNVSAVLAAKGRLAQYLEGGHIVMNKKVLPS